MTQPVLAEIEALVDAGDWNRCYDWWLQTTAEQRAAVRPWVKQRLPLVRENHRKLEKGSESMLLAEANPDLVEYRKECAKIDSFYIGVFATGTRAEVESLDTEDWLYNCEKIADILNHVRPVWLADYVDRLFSWEWIGSGNHTDYSIGHRQWEMGQRLVDLGAVPDPASSGQALGMVFHTQSIIRHRGPIETVYDFIQNRPHVLDRHIWHLFEVAGVGITSLYMCDFLLEQRLDPAPSGENRTWRHAFVRFFREGRIPRDRLLDAVLRGISFDFSGLLPKWYMGLFEALDPTDDEIQQRDSVFLNLVTSDSQRLVSFALNYLDHLDPMKTWNQDQWLRMTSNLLASKTKSLADAGLKYAIKIAKIHPHLRAPLLQQSVLALSHPASGFQEKLLRFFASYPEELTPDMVQEAQAWRDLLPPTLLEKFDKLFRVTVERKVYEAVSIEKPIPEVGSTRLAQDRVIPLIASPEELLDQIAYVLENHRNLEETERVFEGMIRYNGPFKPIARDLQAIAKRAGSRFDTNDPLHEGLYSTVFAWATGTNREHHRLFYNLRMAEIRGFILKENRLPLLSTSTHRGFWVDPMTLVERVLQWQSAELEPGSFDIVFSLLRLSGEGNGPALKMAANLEGVIGRVIRYALGGKPELTRERPELWAAAARARCPGQNAPEVAEMFPEVDPGGGTYPTISLHYRQVKVNYYQSKETFDYDEPGAELSPSALHIHVDPLYVSINCFHKYLFGFPISLHFSDPEVGHCGPLGSPSSLYWLAATWPSDRESVYAQCCNKLIYHRLKLVPEGTSFLPEFMNRFFNPREKLRLHGALLVGLLWVAPVADFRLLASQLLCDVLRARKWDLDMISRMLLKIHQLRSLSIVRLVKAIQSLVEADPATKVPVLQVIEKVVQTIPDLALDAGAGRLFGLWLELLTETKQQVTDPETHAFLQQLQQGKSKVGTIAKRINLFGR